MDETARSFSALVNVEVLHLKGRSLVDAIALEVWQCLGYRYLYHKQRTSKKTGDIRFSYHCAQNADRQHKPKKHENADKHRTSHQMECFDCDGWLHITVSNESTEALVHFKHEQDHIPYCSIDVPLAIKEFIGANPHLNTSQIWNHVLTLPQYQDRTKILFSRRAIYTLWAKTDREKWKMDDDEVESAIKIIERASTEQTGTYDGHPIFRAEPIVLPSVEGFSAVAFALPSVLQKWGGQVREIAMDSAWETNKSQFELFVFIGEISGSGCPLAYLLIKSEKNSAPNSQQKYLESILAHLQDVWGLQFLTTLSDKYWPEINACRVPVKTRLAILKRRPAHYNVLEARLEFPAIDPDFVPVAQETKPTPVSGKDGNTKSRLTSA
ncbi:hypothetical protein B0H10DRAFT_1803925 [Mycena sp. CBHHK59/15]|nr:hypothetical protein B0H10DRAFT_1803925 [Mycena sp. CBHHK59/15]